MGNPKVSILGVAAWLFLQNKGPKALERLLGWIMDITMQSLTQRKMLLLVNGNNIKINRQQHYSTSNFVSANSFIAKFTTYDASLHNVSD